VVLGLLVAEMTVRTVWPAWKDLHPPRVRLTDADREHARAVLPGMQEVELRTATAFPSPAGLLRGRSEPPSFWCTA
jgi:hypothetical protein